MNATQQTAHQRTRWLTLIGTVITQLALGSVYTGAYSMVSSRKNWMRP